MSAMSKAYWKRISKKKRHEQGVRLAQARWKGHTKKS